MAFDCREGIDQPHLLDSAARHVEQSEARKHHDQRLRARDRHVQPIDAKQELDVARQLVGTGGRHRNQTHRRLLPLQLVDRADPDTGRQHARQEIDLRVVGRDHQDVGRTNDALVAIPILIRLVDQGLIDIKNGIRRIQVAIWALLDAGVPRLNLRPGERYARLAEELKRQAYLTREIPKRVTFGRQCRKYPIEAHIAAWRASRAQA
jgi:hypothetical protein